jgi:hypothetical protein
MGLSLVKKEKEGYQARHIALTIIAARREKGTDIFALDEFHSMKTIGFELLNIFSIRRKINYWEYLTDNG